jgi:hypothetical protein
LWWLQAVICRKVLIRNGLTVKNFILLGLAEILRSPGHGSLVFALSDSRFQLARCQFSGCPGEVGVMPTAGGPAMSFEL